MKIFFTFNILVFFINQLFSQCANPANIYTFNHNGKTYEIVKELIELFNMTGKQLKVYKNTPIIDLSEFAKGFYIIQLTEGAYIKRGKFILN
ncbi:MAG: T9SS type A sorting domain-containing protein [bacterium]|nr:T9SS type A sorting domain-containing protein [bacterium]